MKLLLDTHAFIWWVMASPQLSSAARDAIENADDVHVSAASVWEIATKTRQKKLVGFEDIIPEFDAFLERAGFEPLSVSIQAGALAGTFDHDHRDPFDRMLIAQAKIENLTLVSNETLFDEFGVDRLW